MTLLSRAVKDRRTLREVRPGTRDGGAEEGSVATHLRWSEGLFGGTKAAAA